MVVNGKNRILLIEDKKADVLLTKLALKEAEFGCELFVANSVNVALDLLKESQEQVEDELVMEMIILDLNLVGKNGLVFLEEIKKHEVLRLIPLIVFTTSSNESDIYRAYANYANLYITKPLNYDQYVDAYRCLKNLWRYVQAPVTQKKQAKLNRDFEGFEGFASGQVA